MTKPKVNVEGVLTRVFFQQNIFIGGQHFICQEAFLDSLNYDASFYTFLVPWSFPLKQLYNLIFNFWLPKYMLLGTKFILISYLLPYLQHMKRMFMHGRHFEE